MYNYFIFNPKFEPIGLMVIQCIFLISEFIDARTEQNAFGINKVNVFARPEFGNFVSQRWAESDYYQKE